MIHEVITGYRKKINGIGVCTSIVVYSLPHDSVMTVYFNNGKGAEKREYDFRGSYPCYYVFPFSVSFKGLNGSMACVYFYKSKGWDI